MKRKVFDDPYGFIGSILAERYEIEQLIGMGGMAIVYRAKHLMTMRAVALKILKPDQVYANPKVAEYFSNEAKATANLNHRNIVAVMDAACDEDGTAFLVMEYLKGQTLDEVLQEQEFMPSNRVAALFEQICDGVDHAHSRGILHRDLKPVNIMIVKDDRGDEQVKILDFGISKAMTATAKVSATVATITYASPEQLSKGASIDHRSDIYSLGVILYQMLTNALPFDEDSHEHMIYQKMNFVLPSMRQIRPELSMEVEDVIRRALAREPERRFQSATEMARAFWRAINMQTGALAIECADAVTGEPLAGASIILNGKYVGQTDTQGRWGQPDLSPKQYLIEVEYPRYQRWHMQVGVDSNEEASVTVKLKRELKGELIVRSNVPGVRIEIDGRKAGETNEENVLHLESLEAGSHHVRLTHPRYHTAEVDVEISVGEITPLERILSLKPSGVWKTVVAAAPAKAAFKLKDIWKSVTALAVRSAAIKPAGQWKKAAVIAVPVVIALSLGGGYLAHRLTAPKGRLIDPGASAGPSPAPSAMPSSTIIPVENSVASVPASPTSPASNDPTPSTTGTPISFSTMTFAEVFNEANNALRQRRIPQAVELFEYAQKQSPNDQRVRSALADAYPRLADFYFGRRQYAAASSAYLKSLRFKPNDSGLHDRLGDAYAMQRRYDKAIEEYNEVIKLGRTDGLAYYKSGNAYLNGGANAQAVRLCGEASKRDNRLLGAWFCLGHAQDRLGRYDDALSALKKARDLDRSNAPVLFDIGVLYAKKRDLKEAENYVAQLRPLNPGLANRLASEIAGRRRY